MRDRMIPLRTAVVGGFVIVGLVAFLAPVRSQAGPSTGFVNMVRVQKYVKVFQAARDQLFQEQRSRLELLDRHRQFSFLVADEAKRAVELDMKDVQRTAEENQELTALRRKTSDMELEHVKLVGRNNPSEQDMARLNELQTIRNKRSDEIDALQQQLQTELSQAEEKLQKDADDKFVAALKATADQNGLQVIVASHILVPQNFAEGRPTDLRWENVVYYGGRDVTDSLITVMNGGEAPPAPGPDEQGTIIPGAVK